MLKSLNMWWKKIGIKMVSFLVFVAMIGVTIGSVGGFLTSADQVVVGPIKAVIPVCKGAFAITADNTLLAAGSNSTGRFGYSGTSTASWTPVLENVKEVYPSADSGNIDTYVLKNDGTLWVSGQNTNGELGLGSKSQINSWVQAMTDVRSVFPYNGYAFVVKTDGTLWQTGAKFGLGVTTAPTSWTQALAGISVQTVVSFDAGDVYVITTTGDLWVGGNNIHGELGLGTTTNVSNYTKAMTDVQSVATNDNSGYPDAYVIKTDGTLWVAGRNYYGELGNTTTTQTTTWAQTLSGVQDIVATMNIDAYVIKSDGSLWVSGQNTNGELGTGNATSYKVWTQSLSGVQDLVLSSSGSEAYVIKSDNTLWAAGVNSYGVLGNGNTAQLTSWTNVLSDVKYVSCPSYDAYVVKTDGTLWESGRNYYGELGLGNKSAVSTWRQALDNVIGAYPSTYALGPYFAYAIRSDGSLWATGDNSSATLGNGTTSSILSWTGVISSSVDKSELSAAISAAQSEHDAAVAGTAVGDYPQSAIDDLQTAINTAQAVVDNSSATQTDVDNATTVLNSAISTFDTAVVTTAAVDKSALASAISTAQGKKNNATVGSITGNYPQSAVDALGTAITTAQGVVDNSSATQADVDNATAAINSAIATFDSQQVSSGTGTVQDSIDISGDISASIISVEHPITLSYGIDSSGNFTAPDLTVNNTSNGAIDVSVVSLQSVSGGTLQFTDVAPDAKDWDNLNLADSKKYLALGIAPKAGDPWTNPTSTIFWSIDTSPLPEGSLAAGKSAALQLTAKSGKVFDTDYTSKHELVLEFSYS